MIEFRRRLLRLVFVPLWLVASSAATADPGTFLGTWVDDGKKFTIEKCGMEFCDKAGRLKNFRYCSSNKSLYGGLYCPGNLLSPVGKGCIGDDGASVGGLALPGKPILPCIEPLTWDPKKATRCILEIRLDGEDLVLQGYCEDEKKKTYLENKRRTVFNNGK